MRSKLSEATLPCLSSGQTHVRMCSVADDPMPYVLSYAPPSIHACTDAIALRLMCSTYLTFFMRDDLLDEMPLYPYPDPPTQGGSGDASSEVFMAPSVSYSYDQVMTRKPRLSACSDCLTYYTCGKRALPFTHDEFITMVESTFLVAGVLYTH